MDKKMIDVHIPIFTSIILSTILTAVGILKALKLNIDSSSLFYSILQSSLLQSSQLDSDFMPRSYWITSRSTTLYSSYWGSTYFQSVIFFLEQFSLNMVSISIRSYYRGGNWDCSTHCNKCFSKTFAHH